jgi:hypothetical protein
MRRNQMMPTGTSFERFFGFVGDDIARQASATTGRPSRYKMTASSCGWRKRRAKNSRTSSFLTREPELLLNDNNG